MDVKAVILNMLLSVIFTIAFSPALSAKGIDPETDKKIKERVLNLNSVIKIKYTEEVREWVLNYVDKHKKVSATFLGRINIYFPTIENALRVHGMPDELKYLAVVESGLVCHAESKAAAGGLWQFTKPTAERLGLKVNNSIDERRDPIKSTRAALKYLSILHKKYEDWALALAAYNCGDGNVDRAIDKSGGVKDYWYISRNLPKETQEFIPRFIGIAYMMNYYYLHGIEPKSVDDNLRFTATAKVYEKLDLKDLSDELKLDFDVVKALNPAYIKQFIPKSDEENYLTLPESTLVKYLENKQLLANLYIPFIQDQFDIPIPTQDNTVIVAYEEPSAREEELDLPQIKRDNNLEINSVNLARGIEPNNKARVSNYRQVKLKKRTSLADLAQQNGQDLAELLAINNYSETNMPKAGDIIKLR